VRKRTLKTIAGALVAAALVVAPLVTAGASAAEPVGSAGTLEPWTNETNKPAYWQALTDHESQCYKHESNERTEHGQITDDGKTVTLSAYEDGWWGDHWELLVIKAGSDYNYVIDHPVAGVAYASPTNNGGQQAEVSHWIVCKGKSPAPSVVTPTLEVTPPTCFAEGSIARSENAEWTFEENEDGTTTWTAKPKAGTVFDVGVKISWIVDDLSKLTEGCDSEEPEQPNPLTSQTSKTAFDCDSTTAIVTTTTTTTAYVWDEQTEAWVLGTPASVDTVAERPLTPAELAECPLLPGEIESVCVGDVPFLGYEVELPEGYEADSESPVTITFVNPDGEDYVVEDQPLSGALLWPGASNGTPKMWPGWELVNGEYVKTTGNYDWTRNGITVRFDVNPSYETTVAYPQATALCANPPIGGGDDPTGTPTSTDAEALAVTGGGVSPIIVAAGGAALVAGIAVVLIAAYRRRQAGMQ
jgi:hypothetical protein